MYLCHENGNYFSEAFCENDYKKRGLKIPATHSFSEQSIEQIGVGLGPGAYLKQSSGDGGPYFRIPFYPKGKNIGGYMRGQTADNTNGAAWGFYINYIDDSNYYQLWCNTGSPATLYLNRIVSGTPTTIGSYQYSVGADVSGHDLMFTRVGDVWKVWLDGTLRINITDSSPITNYPGVWPIGICSYSGTGADVRIYDVKAWNADDYIYVAVGIGSSAGIYDKAGTVIIADTNADAYGLVALNISSIIASFPLSGQIKVKTAGTVVDVSPIQDLASNRTCILPGTYWSQDIDVPIRNTSWVGKASISVANFYLYNPNLYFDGSLFHLYVEGRSNNAPTNKVAKIFHWTNTAFAKTGWTYQGIAVDFTAGNSYELNGYGDPYVKLLGSGSQANTLIMILQKYVNTSGALHCTIYKTTSTDGGYTWATPSLVADASANGPESERLWGGCIAEFYGKYFIYYEAEKTRSVDGLGNDNVRRLACVYSSDLANWTSRGIVCDTYVMNDLPYRECGGISAPSFLAFGGQAFLIGDVRQEGVWSPQIITNIDGLSFRHGMRLSWGQNMALNDSDFTDKKHMFSNGGIAIGLDFYGCCHMGEPVTQTEGIGLYRGYMIPTVGNRGSALMMG